VKKFITLIIIIFFSSNAMADKLLKSGFVSGEWNLDTNFKVDNPKDKVLIIYNHGSKENDKPSKDCQ